jgi:serine/threonine protein kinase
MCVFVFVRVTVWLCAAHVLWQPENILFSSPDEDARLVIIDFGFAKHASDTLKTPLYTPYYAPPELLQVNAHKH